MGPWMGTYQPHKDGPGQEGREQLLSTEVFYTARSDVGLRFSLW